MAKGIPHEVEKQLQEFEQGMRARLRQVYWPIRNLLDRLHDPKAAPLELRDNVLELLMSAGLVQLKQKVHCTRVGVHPGNRYGDGIVPAKVLKLIAGIFSIYFSTSELDNPTAVEMPPVGHKRRRIFLDFNIRQMRCSSGILPQYADEAEGVLILTATCGHTTQGLRCIWHEVPYDHEQLAPDGKLSLARLRQLQPKYAHAAEEGIEYTVIAWQVEDIFPEIMDLFQESGNQKNWLYQGETRLELMLKMHASAGRHLAQLDAGAPEGALDQAWASVKAEASRGNPPYVSEFDDLIDVVRFLSGGLDVPRYLHLFRDFVRTLKVEREVKGDVWGALARVQVGSPHAAPSFRIACACAMTGASDKYSHGAEQALLTPSEISSLGSKLKGYALQAEAIIQEAEEILKRHPTAGPQSELLLFLLMDRLVHHLFKKPDASRGSFPTLQAIGHQFCQELATLTGVAVRSPWAEPKVSAPKPTAASSAGPRVVGGAMVEFTAGGAIANSTAVLEAKGFRKDGFVKRLSDQMRFRILEMVDQVTLVDDAGVEMVVRADALLKGNFKPMQGEKAIVVLEKWLERAEPSKGDEWLLEETTCRTKLALGHLHAKHYNCLDGLDIIKEPAKSKGVVALRAFAKGELVLVPLTTSMSLRASTEVVCSTVDCKTELADPRSAKRRKDTNLPGSDPPPLPGPDRTRLGAGVWNPARDTSSSLSVGIPPTVNK